MSTEWQPGDPVHVEPPRRQHCLNAGCGTTWVGADVNECPECGGLVGQAAVSEQPTDLGTDFHVGDIVRNRNTGGKSVVRSVGTWSARYYEIVSCSHPVPIEPSCALDESNDMEAFAALPDCEHCGGTGKDIPADFWGGPSGSREGVTRSASDAVGGMEVGSPDWHSLHHTGQGQHHECDWDVCVEWSARQTSAGGAR